MKPHIGFVGIGNMGSPMARRVLGGDYSLTVFDVDLDRMKQFASMNGCRAAATPAELGRHVDIVITMLPNGHVVREAVLGTDGVAAGLRSGGILVDMSSADAAGTRELGAELALRGIAVADAPVSGGVGGAAAGTLSIMVGGEDDAVFRRIEPILQTMGTKLFRAGPLGAGHAAKALNNLMGALSMLGCAEVLLISRQFGLDPAKIFEIINASTGRSSGTESMAKRLPDPTRPLGFALALMAKDVKLASDLARDLKIEAPIAAAAQRILADACDKLGPADVAETIHYLEKISGRP